MVNRETIYDLIAVLGASSVVLAALAYAYIVYVYDVKTLLVSVVMPVALGTAILAARRKKILVYAFLAYIWAVLDDAPVFFDSVLTWPEVTRFHPFLPRLYMNIVIHALTIFFMYMTVRETLKRNHVSSGRTILVSILVIIAFGLAYAQNIPLASIQYLVDNFWYQFDLVEKLLSVAFLFIAVKLSK